MEPILTDAGETFLTYLAIAAATRRPYDTRYKNMIVTIIMTKNFGYSSIIKWLTQQHTGPNGQAYPTTSNDVVEMMNSGNFEPDPFKPKSKRSNRHKGKGKGKRNQNKEKEEETVGEVIGSTPIRPTEEEPPQTENVPDTDNDELSEDTSDESSQEEDSSDDDDDIDTDMERVYAMINSGFNGEPDAFDPETEEEKYYANCNATLNDNEIVRCVTVEPTYKEDDYEWVDFNDSRFDDIKAGWPDGSPILDEKMELKYVYFTGSDFIGNRLGFNPDAGLVYPVVTREMARRTTSTALFNRSTASLEVVVKRVSSLVNKPHDFTPLILHIFGRIEIHSCLQLYCAMRYTRDDRELALAIKTQLEEASGGLILCHKQASYFRCTSMYMNGRWE